MIDPLRPSHERLLYTAGPISANVNGTSAQHVDRAKRIAIELRRRGWSVVCPHLNSVEIYGFTLDTYLAEDFRIISVCDAVVLLPGWRESKGTIAEIDFAACRGIQLVDWTRLLPDWR